MNTTEELESIGNDMINSNIIEQKVIDAYLQLLDFYQTTQRVDRLPRGLSSFVPS
jgi:hypothetical protein